MNPWSLDEFADAVRGRWLAGGLPEGAGDRAVTGASIDTRETRAGDVFFAFKGERADGHGFVDAAFDAGAVCAVVTDVDALRTLSDGRRARVLVVDDARLAMDRAASAKRDRLGAAGATVVAVTGSNGKTSTVRLLHAVLSRAGVCAASIKSHNNTIGLALTLLNAAEGAQFVVCEIGTSRPGEIRALGTTARPDVAVVTSIGRAHLEALRSTEGVVNEKADLLRALRPGGAGLFNADTAHAGVLAGAVPEGAARVGVGVSEGATVRIASIDAGPSGVAFTLTDGAAFRVPLVGVHHATNAALAVAVGRRIGLDDDSIGAALAQAEGAPMRLSVREIGTGAQSVLLVNDAYNANPDSMAAALEAFRTVAGDRPRVLVLGEMRELGARSAEEHAALGRAAVNLGPRLAVFVGPSASLAARAARDAGAATVVEQPLLDATAIAAMIEPGDAVLLKGSRAVGLERAAAAIEDRFLNEPVSGVGSHASHRAGAR